MTKWQNLFLLQSMAGRGTELSDRDAVIKIAIRLAYRDMLTAGRFCLYEDIGQDKEKEEKMNKSCDELQRVLKERDYLFNREIFENLDVLKTIFDKEYYYDNNGKLKATQYGLAQKFVNMTFKYLYIFSCFTELESNHFGKCDCPIDSVILGRLEDYQNSGDYQTDVLNDFNFKDCRWSKMTGDAYKQCQDAISEILPKKYEELKNEFEKQGIPDGREMINELKTLGNLAFDFIEWGNLSQLSTVMKKIN